MTKFYDSDELATMFGVSKWTIREWFKAGTLKGFKLGKQWRMAEEDLKAFLEEKHG